MPRPRLPRPVPGTSLFLLLFLMGAVPAIALRAEDPPLTITTAAADVWGFARRVEGTVPAGACEAVQVRGPAGAAAAWLREGRFAATVPLLPGNNSIEAVCLRAGREHGRSPARAFRVPLDDGPKARIRAEIAGDKVKLDAGASGPASMRPAPLVLQQWAAATSNPAPLSIETDGSLAWITPPDVDGEYAVTLTVTDADGRQDRGSVLFRVVAGRTELVDPITEHPAWVDRAVIYGVVPSLFGPRGLADVTARLDAIAATGATVLWLSPITNAPGDDFGYAVTDHFKLRPDLGSEADLQTLIQSAHARGIRVIMDFIPNHLSDQHPYARDLAANRHRFQIGEDGQPAFYFDWENLKNLNYDEPEVRRMITAAFSHWVRDFGVDGFRVDAAWGVRQRAPDFWPDLRAELKRIDPDILLLAEASARDPYYMANGFDAAYDWTGELGKWAWGPVFQDGHADVTALKAALTNNGSGLPPDSLVLRFLNNNDTGPRFLTRHGPEMTRLAVTLLFTLPGIPLIYTGDEVGAAFEPYDEGPPIGWDDPHELQHHYAALAALRQREPALRGREMVLVQLGRDPDLLAFRRPAPDGDLLVVLNFGRAPALIDPAQAGVGGSLRDLLTGAPASPGPQEIPALGALVLASRP